MTEIEIDELLQDAIDVLFRLDMFIVLFFPNKHEAEGAYKAVKYFFGKSKITILIKKKEERLEIFLKDERNRFVHTREVEYNNNNFNNWLVNGDKQFKITLFMAHMNYRTKNFLPFPDLKLTEYQQHHKLNIVNFEIIP